MFEMPSVPSCCQHYGVTHQVLRTPPESLRWRHGEAAPAAPRRPRVLHTACPLLCFQSVKRRLQGVQMMPPQSGRMYGSVEPGCVVVVGGFAAGDSL
jgi:hypothetical protein